MGMQRALSGLPATRGMPTQGSPLGFPQRAPSGQESRATIAPDFGAPRDPGTLPHFPTLATAPRSLVDKRNQGCQSASWPPVRRRATSWISNAMLAPCQRKMVMCKRTLARFSLSSIAAIVTLIGPMSNVAQADDWTPLWTTATLSQARYALAGTSVGNRAYFGGGWTAPGGDYSPLSGNVNVFDATSGSWSLAAPLPTPRSDLAAAAGVGKVFFAGGGPYGSTMSNEVDILDVSAGTWLTTTLSQPRRCAAAASAGGDVLFAGGGTTYPAVSNVVDIFNADFRRAKSTDKS